MTRIIFIADPHIKAVGGHNRDHAHRLASGIIANENPDESIVIVGGDLMDTPSRRNAQAVARWLSLFRAAGFEVLAVPGNHDLYAHGIDPGMWLPANPSHWNDHIEPVLSWSNKSWPRVFSWHGVQLIGLHTMAGTVGDVEVDLAQGRVGREQLLELTLLLQDGPSVVVGHHRVWWNDVAHKLEDAQALHEVMDGRAIAYLCGHQHRRVRSDDTLTRYHAVHRCTQLHGPGTHRHLRYDVLVVEPGLPFEVKSA